ncbi:serine hydrolase domain-containing protein [Pedobacter sp. JY14-1]|uniref:serine hydrolase domain-containing protein n=1 Tax=Pedobacter sp. JY14-1 TaxID=3034151 RepID=UPI0023E1A034|nr:serine hydrolase domain-containing protein [Pedobacter sp. JY14-1]
MHYTKIALLWPLVLVLITSGCSKNDLHAQAFNKHESIPAEAISFASADYKITQPLSGPLQDSLDAAIHRLFPVTKMPGITAAMLIPGKGLWQNTTGFLSNSNKQKADSTSVFYWASVTKMITATIIDELVQDSKLSYDDKLAKWFPQFEHAREISIGQLLHHTSGLASFNTDTTIFKREKHYTAEDLIDIALQQKNLFPPGKYWSYSNTGYLLLAMIIQQVDKRSYAEAVAQRFAVPLHLSSLKVLTQAKMPANLAKGHTADGLPVNEDYSVPLGTGDIAANAKDMAVFLFALLNGSIIPKTTVAARLQNLYPMPDKGIFYGQGIMVTDFEGINGQQDQWIGHTGGTETYRALLIFDVKTKIFLAVSVNAHIPVEAISRKLISIAAQQHENN